MPWLSCYWQVSLDGFIIGIYLCGETLIKGNLYHKRSHFSGDSRAPRINQGIRASRVLLLDYDKNNCGVVALVEALALTEAAKSRTGLSLDLVEISPAADPPVCWMVDYSKYAFQLKKKKSLQRKNQKKVKLKEIKLRPGTEENDYAIKVRHLVQFLKENDRVKVTVRFRGREMAHQRIGENLLSRLINDIRPYGVIEGSTAKPEVQQRQITVLVVPRKVADPQ